VLKYRVGDLFDYLEPDMILPHCCNDIGGWGSGFVKSLDDNFPEVGLAYRAWFSRKSVPNSKSTVVEGNNPGLGDVQVVRVKLDCGGYALVANMIGQKGVVSSTNPVPIKYDALETAMRYVHESLKEDRKIIAPLFGAGLARGDWTVIEKLIETVWKDRDVTIFELE
jgi:hypothetical protein